MGKRQILLTNDDGIRSPGLWAAAEALSPLGFVTVVAPREQCSGTGRSLPRTSDGIIRTEVVRVNSKDWTVYAVGGTPAQAILHGVLEIMPQRPDLVVSGINYGENVAIGITVSGTIGAAMEAASFGIPSLAISLETEQSYHFTYSEEIDFSVAAHFTTHFARLLLEKHFPEDVHLIKVDVPSDAMPETPWQLTRLARQEYFQSVAPQRTSWDQPGKFDYRVTPDLEHAHPDSDVYVLRIRRVVSVTPLSLDLTSRANFADLEALLRS